MSTTTDDATQPRAEIGPLRKVTLFIGDWTARPLGVLLLLTCLATLSYSNTFSAPFRFDDGPSIAENSQIKDLLVSLGDISKSRYIGFLSFAFNYHIGGLTVWGYHLVNLLIHVTNGFLVYTLVGLLGRTPGLGAGPGSPSPRQAQGVALITALLFVVHPIQTQAVTYIVQRFTSLATLFYLLAVVCYLHWRLASSGPRYGWYAGALAATVLAMKTKEISFTLPVLLVLVEGVGFARPRGKQWLPLLPFGLTLLIIPLSLPGGLGETEAGFARETTDLSRLSYGVTQLRVLVTYLRLLLWPVHQNLDYDYPLYDSLLQAPVFLAGLLLLGLAGLAVYLVLASARWRLAGVGVLWFFLTLAVESSLIPIRDVIYEHRLYLPSVGLLLAGSAVAVPLLARWRAVALTLGVGVVFLFAVATYQRNRVWHDEVSLWSDVVAQSPKKARGHSNLGIAYFEQKQWGKAIQEYEVAVQLDADFYEAHANLGAAYAEQGRWREATHEYEVALQLQPELPTVHNHLGVAYAQQGRLEDAIQEYRTELTRDPAFAEAHNNLGNAYARQGHLEAAIEELAIAIRLQPDLQDVHYNLGNLYARQGRLEDAVAEFVTALRITPNSAEAHNNLGNVYARQGRWEAAIQEYRTVITLQPTAAGVRYNLGLLYTRQGRRAEAREQFATIVRLQPDFTPAQQALAALDAPPPARR